MEQALRGRVERVGWNSNGLELRCGSEAAGVIGLDQLIGGPRIPIAKIKHTVHHATIPSPIEM